jgi:hypothetical protein
MRVDYTDEKTPGLMLRVSPKGVKSFAVLLIARGKRARLTLGKYPRLSLAQARGLALEAQSKAKGGEDPRYAKKGTVGELLPVYSPSMCGPTSEAQRLSSGV